MFRTLAHSRRLLAFAAAIALVTACQRDDGAAGGDSLAGDSAAAEGPPPGVPADWVYHAPDSLDIEWWAPPTFVNEEQSRRLPACDSTTPGADSAVAPLGEEVNVPMTVALRRGERDSILSAHEFGAADGGDYVTHGRGGSAALVQQGTGWIALAGEVWVGRAQGAGTQPVHVLLGVTDAGGGCHVVMLEAGEEMGQLDTLAAVLKTVRRGPE